MKTEGSSLKSRWELMKLKLRGAWERLSGNGVNQRRTDREHGQINDESEDTIDNVIGRFERRNSDPVEDVRRKI